MTRRLLLLLVVLLLLGAPALAMTFACVGKSCARTEVAEAHVPFCSLPSEARTLLENGFYKGRSPDAFAFAKNPSIWGWAGTKPAGADAPWPYSGQVVAAGRVPIVLWGDGVQTRARLPTGTELDQIAPTLASIIGLERGHPEVRAGTAVPGAAKTAHPRLVLMVGVKTFADLTQEGESPRLPPEWKYLGQLAKDGASTLQGGMGSLPVDSAAALTTMGTGGLPSQHGITGSVVRNNAGDLVEAWGKDSPVPVIAALGDDLDHNRNEKPLVGMVATGVTDRGLIGGNWYIGSDVDRFRVAAPSKVANTVDGILASGLGSDATTDLLGVTLDGSNPAQADRQLEQIVEAARRASGGSLTVAVAAVGYQARKPELPGGVSANHVVQQVESAVGSPVVQTAVPGGLFLDQQVLADRQIPAGRVVQALKSVTAPGTNGSLMQDAYPAFAVSFARYCSK